VRAATALALASAGSPLRHLWPHAAEAHLLLRPMLVRPPRSALQMMSWLQWKPPAKVCVSWDGIFTHREIDQ